jgi:cold shock CspA family protein
LFQFPPRHRHHFRLFCLFQHLFLTRTGFRKVPSYGFIKEVETGEKYFVHISGLVDKVKEGNLVTYDLEKGAKGMNAVNVALEVEKAKEKKENKETLNTES